MRAPAPTTAVPTRRATSERPLCWEADPYTRALRTGRGPLFLRSTAGWLLPLDVQRWCAEPDGADLTVLARCRGAVLDVGCGPGRLVRTLAARGHRALGIDISPEAVRCAARTGGPAMVRSVFDPLPDEGRWDTALLVDGNIGIGGNPAALLDRMAQIVRPSGTLLVETAPPGLHDDLDEHVEVHLDDGNGPHGDAFPWARVGPRALLRHSKPAGWTPACTWTAPDRRFVALVRHGTTADARRGVNDGA